MHILLIIIVYVNNHIKNVDYIFSELKNRKQKTNFINSLVYLNLLKHRAKKDRKRKSTLKVGSNFLNSKIYQ